MFQEPTIDIVFKTPYPVLFKTLHAGVVRHTAENMTKDLMKL